jgi:membrane fusion protein, multidrug efflux system
MSDESPALNQSITPAATGTITLAEDSTPPKHPKLTVLLSIAAMLLLLLGIGAFKFHQISQGIAAGKAFKMPPDAVTSLTVTEETTTPTLDAVGSLASLQGVMLSADLPGIVTAILFDSGTAATNGQLLVQLDTRQEEAQLRTARAKLDLARQNLQRAHDLGEKHVIAQSA